jgi:large subunit ribosomal protein L32e
MTDTKELLEKRKAQKSKKPHFLRKDWYKKSRLALVWRKPKGRHNKLRKSGNEHGKKPNTGFGGPAAVRHFHKSGLVPVIVNTIAELNALDAKTNGAVLASNLGKRKKIQLMEKAKELSIRILNFKDTEAYVSKATEELASRKAERTKTQKEKEAKAKEAEKKEKEASKKEEQAETQEDQKETEKKEAEKIITKANKK